MTDHLPRRNTTIALIVATCILNVFVSAQTYKIVDTGQDQCYDNSAQITPPSPGGAFYGQDAQHSGYQPAYQDNGDSTITDLNTGLMWQKYLLPDKYSYDDALAGADTFSLAGHDDWRLPSIKELYSLILFTGKTGTSAAASVPYIDTSYFEFRYGDEGAGERFIDAQYASSTEYVGTTMNGDFTIFGVNFADGRIKGYGTVLPGNVVKTFEVRYVRGDSTYGINDFEDNGDGTITDHATRLVWTTGDTGALNWEDALAWVQQKNSVNYLGFDDWRLPNAKELQSIVDYTRSPQTTASAAIDPLFTVTPITDEGGGSDFPFYWASTTHADGDALSLYTKAVYLAFGEALGFMEIPPMSGNYQLLDVHGAGAQRSDPKEGDPADYPYGFGPQGDVIRIFNYVRMVRDYTDPVNQSPDTPDPPDGPGAVLLDTLASYGCVTEDPEGDSVYYYVEWGDSTDSGWLGPYAPDVEIFTAHSWDSVGMYSVRVKAKDINENETGWSAIHVVSIGEDTADIVDDGWNLLSVPYVVPDPRSSVLYPTASSSVYGYFAGYLKRDTLLNGEGYWVKFDGDQFVELTGDPRPADTVELNPGWNLIGSLSESFDTASIVQSPPGIVVSPYYGYDAGYFEAESLDPRGGYWVKASGAGSLVMNTVMANVSRSAVGRVDENSPRGNFLSFRTETPGGRNVSREHRLAFGAANDGFTGADVTELPPKPPPGAFDVRFSDNTMAAFFPDGPGAVAVSVPILLQSGGSPVVVSWRMTDDDAASYILVIKNGNRVLRRQRLAAGGSVIIRETEGRDISLERGTVPVVFDLDQNYPNPFNPSTSIAYSLPSAGMVTLRISNILGQEVAVLVSELQGKGAHSAVWNAGGFPSGIYFYQMTAAGYSRTRKMLLLK